MLGRRGPTPLRPPKKGQPIPGQAPSQSRKALQGRWQRLRGHLISGMLRPSRRLLSAMSYPESHTPTWREHTARRLLDSPWQRRRRITRSPAQVGSRQALGGGRARRLSLHSGRGCGAAACNRGVQKTGGVAHDERRGTGGSSLPRWLASAVCLCRRAGVPAASPHFIEKAVLGGMRRR